MGGPAAPKGGPGFVRGQRGATEGVAHLHVPAWGIAGVAVDQPAPVAGRVVHGARLPQGLPERQLGEHGVRRQRPHRGVDGRLHLAPGREGRPQPHSAPRPVERDRSGEGLEEERETRDRRDEGAEAQAPGPREPQPGEQGEKEHDHRRVARGGAETVEAGHEAVEPGVGTRQVQLAAPQAGDGAEREPHRDEAGDGAEAGVRPHRVDEEAPRP